LAAIHLKLLGQFECRMADGTPLSLQTRKAEVLLAYLALKPGIRHPRERLINLLWSNRSEEQARNSLRQALSAIKKPLAVLNHMPLEVDRTTVRIDASLIQVDALQFEQIAEELDTNKLACASELYRGEFLEGINIRDSASEEWLAQERDRYKRIIVNVLTRLSAQQSAATEFAAAIESAEALVKHDPLTESGWRTVMKAFQANGDRNHALLAYKRCHAVLQNELGVEPESVTIELRDQIKQGTTITDIPLPTSSANSIRLPEAKYTSHDVDELSILVLPFENLSNDPDQQYFSDGITEGVIMGLSQYPSLSVLSRHYSFAVQERKLSLTDIAVQFGVRYVIEGSVRKTPNSLRITTQLVNTETGKQIWGRRFDSDQSKIFDIEDELTRTIVANIIGKLDMADGEISYRKPAKDLSSYDLLMQGKYHLARFNPADNLLGRKALQSCIARDPECETAHSYLYRINILDWLSGWTEPRATVFQNARSHIEKAISLSDDDSIVQASYAEFLLFDKDYDHCENRAQRAYRLNPNDTETLAILSLVHAGLGNVDLALQMADTCRSLDPFHPWMDWSNGIVYYTGKRFQDAIDAFKKMPNPADEISGWLAACYEKLGQHTTAEKYLHTYVETVRKNMTRPPVSREDWHKLWQATSAAKHDYAGDNPFDVLCAAGLGQYIDDFVLPDPETNAPAIAVLPFDNLSGDPEQEYFSDGITDTVIFNLSLFADMRVKSRSSSFTYKDQIRPADEIARELGVDYVVEGSIRKSNDRVRIIVQLIDGQTGNQIWGERYDAVIDDIFLLEEKLSNTIAATVTGRIDSDLQKIAIAKTSTNSKAYDLLLQGTNYLWRFNQDDMVIAIEKFNDCLVLEPDNYRTHANLFYAHVMNYLERWTDDFEQSFAMAGLHANKAFELEPGSSLALLTYAEYKYFCRDYATALTCVDKALKLNPHDPEAASQKGMLLNVLGEGEQALGWAKKCLELDPHHVWGEWVLSDCLASCERYEEAIDVIKNANSPTLFLKLGLAYYSAMAGQEVAARDVLQEFLCEARATMKSCPQSRDEWYEYWTDQLPFKDTSISDASFKVLERLGICDQLPGLNVNDTLPTIVVLPFSNLSGDPEQEYFSDGITDSIILNLSLFSGIKAKSRHACFMYKDSEKTIEEIGSELDADYIIEGSIRKSGSRLRLNVQLIETSTSNQIWGKRYDGNLEDIFDLETTLSLTIAGQIGGKIGREIQRSAIKKPTSDLGSYDFYLRGLYHMQKFTPDDFVIAKNMFQKSIDSDPEFADAYSFMCTLLNVDTMENWIPDRSKSLKEADYYAHNALKLYPENALIHSFMAEHQNFKRKFKLAEEYADRAIELNPNLPDGYAQKAWSLKDRGEDQEAKRHADITMSIDPHHPYSGWISGEVYRGAGDYEKALKAFRSIPTPPNSVNAQIAACLGALNRNEEAREEMQKYHALAHQQMPAYPTSEEQWRSYWFDAMPYSKKVDSDEYFDLLLQAGLCELAIKTFDPGDLTQYPAIAVLPFSNLSNDPEQEYFSDGISENIIRGLSMYKGLVVKSSQSSFSFRDSEDAIQAIANKLKVKYVVDGSVRKVGNKIRLAAQLIESESGNQLWGKHYDADLEDVLTLEDELSQTITGTIRGRIDSDIQETAVRKPSKNPQSYDLYLRGSYHVQKYTLEDQTLAKKYLAQCIELDPENANAHAQMAGGYFADLEDNRAADRQKALHQAGFHIERALQLEPDNAFVHGFMAEYFMYARGFDQAAFHADKAMELNPTLPDGYAQKAWVLAATRRNDEALEYAGKCLSLDPHHSFVGWIVGGIYGDSGQYEKAIDIYRSLPHTPVSAHLQIAGFLVGAGKLNQAKKEMQKYHSRSRMEMTAVPQSESDWFQYLHSIAAYEHEEDSRKFFNLAKQAGLCDYQEKSVQETPSIAVLPFQNLSGDSEQQFFATGITNDIVNILSKFKHLRTVSSYSTALYADRSSPVTQIAKELNVRYILDGGIRKSGDIIRINVQLVDSETNANIWSDQFDRKLDDIFAIQDQITIKIASAMKVKLLYGERASEYRDGLTNVKAWEYCVLSADLADSYVKDNISEAQQLVKKALLLEPDYQHAWSLLGWTHWQQAYAGWSDNVEQSLHEAEVSAARSMKNDPDYWDGWALMSFIHLMRDKPELAVEAGNKAANIAPGNFDAVALSGFPLNYAGQHEKAIAVFEKSLKLATVYPNWAGVVGAYAYQNVGQVSKAIETYQQSIDFEPESSICHYYLMDLLIEIGELEKAQRIAEQIRSLPSPLRIEGVINTTSHNQKERERFRRNLAKMGFHEAVGESSGC
jgi:TolB-like protein/DNA-binding SARP family transcriptional activator/Tfp pilus assembly protein PilF